METPLGAEEILTGIEIPLANIPAGGRIGMRYEKLNHPASGYAVVGVAAVITTDGGGLCRKCRVAVTGACAKATRAEATENLLVGERLEPEAIARAAGRVDEGLGFVDDHRASASYRERLIGVDAERALLERYAMILDPCTFVRHEEACQVFRILPELYFKASPVGVGQLY